jgi:hypothetical protein
LPAPHRSYQASTVATTSEILHLIEGEKLANPGCGAVDMALLASVRLTPAAVMWTVDKNLDAQATRLGLTHRGASA